MRHRCAWCGTDPLMIAYHDSEWGVPAHDDRVLFEFLLLEGAQAGLSWETVLRKRQNYRAAFHGFDPERVARYGPRDVKRLLGNPGIIAIANARAFLDVQAQFGSFDTYAWRFVGGTPIDHRIAAGNQVPAKTQESEAMSRDLVKRGFKFVGPTICYAFMQATGMVNDHEITCFRHTPGNCRDAGSSARVG
jgi:DNA-3-methyladenine glycosylase I